MSRRCPSCGGSGRIRYSPTGSAWQCPWCLGLGSDPNAEPTYGQTFSGCVFAVFLGAVLLLVAGLVFGGGR